MCVCVCVQCHLHCRNSSLVLGSLLEIMLMYVTKKINRCNYLLVLFSIFTCMLHCVRNFFYTGSSCDQVKFLVCVNILGNKDLSDF